MKFAFVLSLLLAVSPIAFGQSDKAAVHQATGVVTKVDKNKVSIKHEAIPSLNWPPMTMAFTVKDRSLMEKMKKGQKVNFEFIQDGRDYVVTAVK
jgi:Cu(I)/Ag(I) efflux system protein CusF